MSAVDLDIESFYKLFPEPWPSRLASLNYSEVKLSEMQAHFEQNWYQQIDQSIGLNDEHLSALTRLAADVWSDELLRHFALICGHFLFNASDKELNSFDWSTETLELFNIKSKGLFYLLCFLSRFDQAIAVYREQRISLEAFCQTANRIGHLIEDDGEDGYRFNEHGLLALLCQGKIINIGGLVYLPERWTDRKAIWRNGLDGSLREEVLNEGEGSDPLSLLQAAKSHGLDVNVWQLKVKPGDKILKIVFMNDEIEEAEAHHSLSIADRFFKDPDHFHNFVAYDFRFCTNVNPAFTDQVVLREE